MSSRYWFEASLSKMPLPRLAARALFSIMPMNSASNWAAASFNAPGSCAARCRSCSSPVRSVAAGAAAGAGAGTILEPLDHDQLRVERAGLAQSLEDRDEVAGRGANFVDGLDDLVERRAGLEHEHSMVAWLVDADVRLLRRHRAALTERVRLAHERRLGDLHDERAVRDGGRADADVRADHDRPGARVHDHPRRRLRGLDFEVL